MQHLLDRCRARVGMTVPPIISPEIFEQVRQHIASSIPSSIASNYLGASELILQLFCPPPSAYISRYLENAITYITGELCSLEDATAHQHAVITESARYVFEALLTPSLVDPPPMAPEDEKSPDKYGLYLFHLKATQGGITASYQRYVLPCLKAIYNLIALETNARSPLRSSRARSLAYDHSLSLRHFLRYAHIPQMARTTYPPSVSEIDAAFELFAKDTKEKLDTKTVALHKQRVLVAFGYETQNLLGPRPRWSRSETTEHGPADQYFHSQTIPAGEDPWDDPDHTIAREVHYAMPREAFNEHECPEEYACVSIVTPSELEESTIAASIYKRKQAAATAIAQSRRHWWDRATLPLLAYIQFLVNGNSLDPRFALGWLVGHTGQLPARLADLRFVNDTHTEHGVSLHVATRSLIYRQPHDWTGWKRSKHSDRLQDCLPSSEHIIVQLPQEVWYPLAPYLEHRLAIQDQLPAQLRSIVFLTLESPHFPISVHSLDEYLKDLIPLSYPFRITASSLARSFWHLYGGRFGREDLILPYVAGRVPRAIKSQLFYVRMSMDRIVQDYWKSARAFLQALLAEAKASDEGTASHTLTQTLMRIFPFPCDNFTAPATPPPMIANEAVGSEAVPRRDKVQAFISRSTETLNNLSNEDDPHQERRSFNLFMIVTRYKYAFATGLRPVGDSRLSLNNVVITGPDSSYVMIGEKVNARFADLGLIKHAPTAHHLYLSARDAVMVYLSSLRPTNPSILDDYNALGRPIFFLIDEQGRIVLMQPSLVRTELSTLGMSEALIAPLNAPRHYLLTYLFDQRVARPLRDKIARHQHEGYEWFSLLSGTDTHEADEILCGVIEAMLSDLGIRPVQFKLRRTP